MERIKVLWKSAEAKKARGICLREGKGYPMKLSNELGEFCRIRRNERVKIEHPRLLGSKDGVVGEILKDFRHKDECL